jgi:type I restriction enzyme S subunit
MSAAWSKVKLGEVLGLSDTSVPSSGLGEINLAGVYSFGRGLFARGPMLPSNTSYRSYNRLVVDDLVISQPKAWEGALARVTHDFDGWYLSPVFSTFRADSARLEPAFLDWFCKRKAVWTELQRNSRGIGARRETVSPETFLTLQIPLPPLAEQRRIVARIEELATKIEEARSLRDETEDDTAAMLGAAYRRIADGAPEKPLSEVAPLNRRPVTVELDKSYPQIAVRSFGRGTFHKPPLNGSEVTWEKPFLVKVGDILVSNIKAWEGALAVARPEDDGRVGSHRYLTCVPLEGVATSRFVCFHLLTPEGLHDVGEASPGSADRNRTLGTKAFLRIPIPVPEYSEQVWFDSLSRQVDALKRLQAETAAELDALLPSILDKAFKGEL